MDYMDWFATRLSQLRLEKGVSARDMSLSLGQSESYINKIENRRIMPSMSGFFYICEYLGLEPREFFETDNRAPAKVKEIMEELGKLSPQKVEHLLLIVKDLTEVST